MKKTYIITNDVDVPVVAGGTAHKQAQVRMKRFRKGQIVRGELKHSNNKPSFVLVGRMMVIPVECVKEIQGKDVTSKFSGADMDEIKKPVTPQQKAVQQKSETTVKYMDALLIGAVLGFGAMFFAEKKGWVTSEDNKLKMYGAIGGAFLGIYLVYRKRSSNMKSNIVKIQAQ